MNGPGQTIIIIHPGSLKLRIGRASNPVPFCCTHAVARKKGRNSRQGHVDYLLPETIERSKEVIKELEDCRLQVSHVLQSSLQSDERRRYATPPQQIAAFNRRSTPEIVTEALPDEWLTQTRDSVYGDDIFNLDPVGYNIHFPIRRGQLNIHEGIGGSLFNVLDHLQAIWEYAIEHKLGIPIRELKDFKAVLIIPDLSNRVHLKELTNLLMNMGFGSALLVQDHVAATFGAGLSAACVIDCGDQKTSVSCVEDGISQANTRILLEYGGADITQTFFWLLQKCAFPYNCDPKHPKDANLLMKLKEEFCHVNLDVCGAQEKVFDVSKAGSPMQRYTIQVGDECLVAPLGLFHTELMNLTGQLKTAHTQIPPNKASQLDSEDCFGAAYLRDTGVNKRCTKEQTEQLPSDGNVLGPNTENPEEDENLDPDQTNMKDKDFVISGTQIIGVDQAILKSIERCTSEEMKRKMFGNILIVGGGMKFVGIEKWLQKRLLLQYQYRMDPVTVIRDSKDIDSTITVWRGAAILSSLESAAEYWITTEEWNRHGVKILREKVPFVW